VSIWQIILLPILWILGYFISIYLVRKAGIDDIIKETVFGGKTPIKYHLFFNLLLLVLGPFGAMYFWIQENQA